MDLYILSYIGAILLKKITIWKNWNCLMKSWVKQCIFSGPIFNSRIPRPLSKSISRSDFSQIQIILNCLILGIYWEFVFLPFFCYMQHILRCPRGSVISLPFFVGCLLPSAVLVWLSGPGFHCYPEKKKTDFFWLLKYIIKSLLSYCLFYVQLCWLDYLN